MSWHAASIEIASEQSDTDASKNMMVAREKIPFPLIIHAEAGAIINSLRSSLDILAASLARRNGVTPDHTTHFPILRSQNDFIDPLEGIENKKWLSQADKRIIKSLHPYKGGNADLWSLHSLDIERKHERLIALDTRPYCMFVTEHDSQDSSGFFSLRRLENKTVLLEFARDAPEPQVTTTLDIIFDEVDLPAVHGKRVIPTLWNFAVMAAGIIERFDTP